MYNALVIFAGLSSSDSNTSDFKGWIPLLSGSMVCVIDLIL